MRDRFISSFGLEFIKNEAKRLHDSLVCKFGLSLKIPLSTYTHVEGVETVELPYIKPVALLERLLTTDPWLLFGGCEESEAGTLLQSFWTCYQKEHPDHELFQHADPERLRHTFPITLHGDGGRTQKKQPLEIFSFQPVLGLSTRTSMKTMMCHCQASMGYGGVDLGRPETQGLNSKFSTYLTHFLIFAFPSKKYDSFENLLTGFLEEVSLDISRACRDGVLSPTGVRFYPACIGFKLDMEWMAKVGSLDRSYQNVGHVTERPCCHECDAGDVGVPFEDVNPSAIWVSRRFNTIPWQSPPPWRSIPFDTRAPAKILRRDAFHVFRLGICRNFLASCLFLLIYMGCSLVSFHMLVALMSSCLNLNLVCHTTPPNDPEF